MDRDEPVEVRLTQGGAQAGAAIGELLRREVVTRHARRR